MAGGPAAAQSREGHVGVRAGVERISGDYGGDIAVQDLYVPVTVLVERRRIGFRATIPYLEVEFIDPVDSSTYTESGLGDVVLGLTIYDLGASRGSDWSVDLTTKIELGTADEDRGLGNGATDYSVVADVWRSLARGALIASVGYKVRGEPAGVALEDGWLLAVGGIRRFSATTTGSVFIDYRQSSVLGVSAIRELTAAWSRRLRNDWRLQGHIVRGLSDTTIDLGVGLSVRRDF